jgi:Excalibur calcium-binding domain
MPLLIVALALAAFLAACGGQPPSSPPPRPLPTVTALPYPTDATVPEPPDVTWEGKTPDKDPGQVPPEERDVADEQADADAEEREMLAGVDQDCADFPDQATAQRYFTDRGGGPNNNVDRLDADGDGVACELN